MRRYGALLTVFLLPLFSPGAFSGEHAPWFSASDPSAPKILVPMPTTIRVCVRHAKSSFQLGATGAYDYVLLEGGHVFTSNKTQKVAPISGGVFIGKDRFRGDVVVAPIKPTDFLTINNRRYRGAVILEPVGRSTVDVIEQLPLDEYLYGVLPREMGSEWPLEALKAQAVVSRTYVIANRVQDPNRRYDVASDVSDQVYGGLEDEAPMSNRAVSETRGEVLLNDAGKPLQAFFHSSCGGRTETPPHVWRASTDVDGFTSVRDSYCTEDPYYRWKMDISADTVTTRLRRAGIRIGSVEKIKIEDRSPSDRVETFRVYGSKGKADVGGNRFRIAIGPEKLRSTFITDLSKTRHGFHFEGRGWGHGVGLCQWGARGRARAGQTYDQILKAFYPDAIWARVTE